MTTIKDISTRELLDKFSSLQYCGEKMFGRLYKVMR